MIMMMEIIQVLWSVSLTSNLCPLSIFFTSLLSLCSPFSHLLCLFVVTWNFLCPTYAPPHQTVMVSLEGLSKIVDPSQLTADFEGSLEYNHDEWIEVWIFSLSLFCPFEMFLFTFKVTLKKHNLSGFDQRVHQYIRFYFRKCRSQRVPLLSGAAIV